MTMRDSLNEATIRVTKILVDRGSPMLFMRPS